MTYAVMAWAGGECPAFAVALFDTREAAARERDLRADKQTAWRFYVAEVA